LLLVVTRRGVLDALMRLKRRHVLIEEARLARLMEEARTTFFGGRRPQVTVK
jgi:hypothetical protein